MRKAGIKSTLVVLGIILLSGVYILAQQKEVRSQSAMPGTFALKDQNSAIEVGRTVANGELAKGFKSENVKLVKAEAVGNDEIRKELNTRGTIPDTNAFMSGGTVWVVTFAGSFSPKRHPKDEKPVYSTMIIYLRSEDGSVMGVSMHGQQDKKASTPTPGIGK